MTVLAWEEVRYTVEGKELHTGGQDPCNDCQRGFVNEPSVSTASPKTSISGSNDGSVVSREQFCQKCGYECHCHENEFASAECGDEWGSSMFKCENDFALAVMRMNALAPNDSTAHVPAPYIATRQCVQTTCEGSDDGFAELFCQKCGYECHCYENELAGTECEDEWGIRCQASR